jgi:hypothetical protein
MPTIDLLELAISASVNKNGLAAFNIEHPANLKI